MVSSSDLLIDVSRPIWRLWRGGLPTGIDRVCLAYIENYSSQARAVVQYRGGFRVLTKGNSDRLFDLIKRGGSDFRRRFAALAAKAFATARRGPQEDGLLYLNIGHTGLDAEGLPRWIQETGSRAIYFVHDLIPLLHPEYCRPGEYPKHERRMTHALESATGLIGNSQATLDDLAAFARQRGIRVTSGLAAWIAGSPIPKRITPTLFDRPHFIVVSTIEGRKNHSLLLHVWQRLAHRLGDATPLLVIVGQRGWEANHAIAMLDRSPELQAHVMELSTCGDTDMASLITGARALLMPSFAEGFGLPVAEALELGVPVIASDLPVFREFAGEIPTYLDPLDGPGWEQAIIDFIGDSVERKRQLQAVGTFHPPTWADHFRRVDAWLETL